MVDVDLGELTRLGDALQHLLESVEVPDGLEHTRHLPHRHRLVATEVQRLTPRHVRKCLLQIAAELAHLPLQVHVFEQRIRELLDLRALFGRHRVQQLLHGRHRLRHLLQQFVQCLGVAREEIPEVLHELLEVRLLASLALLEHLVEARQHVLHPRQLLGRHVLHALGHLVEVALHQLLAQLVHQAFELRPSGVVHEVIVLQRLHAARKIVGDQIEFETAFLRQLFDDFAAAFVIAGTSFLDAPIHSGALVLHDIVELLRDVVVHPAEITLFQLLLTPFPQPLQHLLHTHELLAVAILESLLEHATHGRVQVAVIEELVGHLGEQRIGVEIESHLGSVPGGVLKSRGFSTRTTSTHRARVPPSGSSPQSWSSPQGPRSRPQPPEGPRPTDRSRTRPRRSPPTRQQWSRATLRSRPNRGAHRSAAAAGGRRGPSPRCTKPSPRPRAAPRDGDAQASSGTAVR